LLAVFHFVMKYIFKQHVEELRSLELEDVLEQTTVDTMFCRSAPVIIVRHVESSKSRFSISASSLLLSAQ